MNYKPWIMTQSLFKVGDRVRVIKQRKYPSEKLLGLVGTVRSIDYGNDVSVVLDECKNTRSSYGCYYFRATDLVRENEIMEEKNMEKITGYLNCVAVEIAGLVKGNRFYVANFDSDLNVGDYCAVDYGSKLFLATVIKISDTDVDVVGEVVAKVNTDAYNARVKVREKAAELKTKMEERAKQLQDVALYKMLAENDPDMANLLHEYQELTNG